MEHCVDTAILRYDAFILDQGTRRRAEDGALIVTGRLARTGIQTYKDGENDRREYRPDIEVFEKDSLSSFEGIVVTDLHPSSGIVNPSTYRSLSTGHIQNPRKDGDHLAADFYIHDQDMITAIEDGRRTELSAGYFAHLDFTPGEFQGQRYDAIQRKIRANHVALLPSGMARAGRSAKLLLDSKGYQIPPNTQNQDGGPPPPEDIRMEEYTINIDGITYTVKSDGSARQAIGKLENRLTAERKVGDGLQAKLDAANEKISKLETDLATAQDPARVDSIVKERSELIEKARKLGGEKLDCSGSTREIQERALETKGVECDGKSDDYVAARFDAAIESQPENGTTIVDAVSRITSKPQTQSKIDHSRLRASRAKYIANNYGGE